MLTITKEDIKNIFYANLFYEIHKTEEIISLFKKNTGKILKNLRKKQKAARKILKYGMII